MLKFTPGASMVLGLLIVSTACRGQAQNPSDQNWQTVSPADVGLDPAPLARLREEAAAGRFNNLHAILVAKDGKLVFEEYYAGFDAETLQYTASVSKSVGSILLGVAMEQGLIAGVEQGFLDMTLGELLPEQRAVLAEDPRKSEIRLDQILSMSGGLAWDETSLPYSDSDNDWIRASREDDPIGFALARPVVADPGTQFNYHGVYSIFPSYLIQREVGVSAEEFAAEKLFAPLGITEWEWESIASGLTDTDGGLYLRPRDMLKLGQLYLDGGVWDGDRIVSEAWVEESTQRQIVNDGMPDYCLLWWCDDFHYGDRSAYTFFASGHGGQKIFVFPSFDLVVVLTHQVFDNGYGEVNNIGILSRYVLPAVDPAPTPPPITLGPEALARFAGEYGDLDEPDEPDAPGSMISITAGDGHLIASSEGQPTIDLFPTDSTKFVGSVLDLFDATFEFETGAAGEIEGMTATWGFTTSEGRKVGP